MSGAWADAYDDGLRAYEANRYEEAIAIWTTLAEQGNVQAQFNLGFIHEFGYGTGADYAAAFHWYLRAAENGHEQARRFVAWMYETGKGVARDVERAREWQRIAAVAAEPDAVAHDDFDAAAQALFEHLQAELERAAARYEIQQSQPAAPTTFEAANCVG
jgi:TPR repeat protein